jgi:hypothetical protein
VSEDFLSLDAVDSRIDQHNKALEFAKLYVETFVLNESGRALLAHWTQTYAQKRTPIDATLNQYVAAETMRAFIQGVHDQITFASREA